MNRRPKTLLLAACGFAASLVAGCAAPTKPARPTPTPYTGPTDPLDVVLSKINANTGRITTLRAQGNFEAWIVEKDPNDPTFLNGQITLLHTKPNQVRLIGEKDLAGPIFLLGNNGNQFWLTAFGKVNTTWYGTPNRPGEANTSLPISPELLVDVLGVATLNVDLLAQPVPTMRFNPDYDAYMLTWHVPLRDRWVTLREVWYDRQTLTPRLIWLFDRNGRVVLRAKLADFQPITLAAAGEAGDAPVAARSFDLSFPESGSRLVFRLDDVRDKRGGAPNALSYRFDPTRTGTAKEINLDQPTDR